MKPHEFLASVRAKARARAAAPRAAEAPAAAPIICADDKDVPLDPAWIAEQERAAAAAERQRTLSIADDSFADAIWRCLVDEAFHDPSDGGPSHRLARFVSLGTASGLTAGQFEALQRLQARTDAACDVVGAVERRRASGRLQVHGGANGRNY